MHTCFLSRTLLASLVGLLCILIGGILTASVADALEIIRFDANRVKELSPGTELVFRLEGTPRATATVTISGLKPPITLRETEAGLYEGSYTLRTSDRLPSNPEIRATLRQGTRTTTAMLSEPLMSSAPGPSSRSSQSRARRPEIQRFTMEPDRVEPGAEMVFTLEGTPNATATLTIRDIARDIPMTEVQPGVYEGRYTVRRQDDFSATDVTATLEANGQAERTRLATQPETGAATGAARTGSTREASFPLEVTAPRDMAEVQRGPIEVRGRSAPNVALNVRVEATNALSGLIGGTQNVLSRTVTTDERGNFAFSFEPPAVTVPGTRYAVHISGTLGGQEKSKQLTLVQR